jgi:short-subunit dehydrogenase
VALLARRPEPLKELAEQLRKDTNGGILESFPTDTSPESLTKTFAAIKDHASFKNLKLKLSIFSVKHSSKKPFLEETHGEFMESLNTYGMSRGHKMSS